MCGFSGSVQKAYVFSRVCVGRGRDDPPTRVSSRPFIGQDLKAMPTFLDVSRICV